MRGWTAGGRQGVGEQKKSESLLEIVGFCLRKRLLPHALCSNTEGTINAKSRCLQILRPTVYSWLYKWAVIYIYESLIIPGLLFSPLGDESTGWGFAWTPVGALSPTDTWWISSTDCSLPLTPPPVTRRPLPTLDPPSLAQPNPQFQSDF